MKALSASVREQQLSTMFASYSLCGCRTSSCHLIGLQEPPTALIGGIAMPAIGCIEEAHSRGEQASSAKAGEDA
jgi:hypothetical protein